MSVHHNMRSLIPVEADGLGVTVIVLDAIFLALAAVALGIRIWSRRIKGHGLYLNDYAVLLAWPFTAGLVTTAVLAVVPGGAGQHAIDVSPSTLPDILKGYIAADMLWAAANTAVKVSILHLYVTVFGQVRLFRLLAYAVMAIVVAFGAGTILTGFLICQPFAKTWNPRLPGSCGSTLGFVLATSIVNVTIDFMIISLPMPMVWQLQMARSRKIALTITFGLGLVVCVITILRIVMAARFNLQDFTYDLAKLAIVTDLEPLLGMIIACLPLFPPAFKRMFGTKVPVSRNLFSSIVARLWSKDSTSSSFRHFDNSSPFTDTAGKRTENHIARADSKPGSSLDDLISNIEMGVTPQTAIQVKRGWEVRSDSHS